MKTVNLCGRLYQARSPSLFTAIGQPIQIHFDGRSWLVTINGVTGIREFATKEDAAKLIALAFAKAYADNLA